MNINNDRYSVIQKWTEPDGVEAWNVISYGPFTYDEALKVASNAGRHWKENVTEKYRSLPHSEIPIEYNKLQNILINEGIY